MNTYPLVFHMLVFLCVFIQRIPSLEDERFLFVFKYGMMTNSAAVLQFVKESLNVVTEKESFTSIQSKLTNPLFHLLHSLMQSEYLFPGHFI